MRQRSVVRTCPLATPCAYSVLPGHSGTRFRETVEGLAGTGELGWGSVDLWFLDSLWWRTLIRKGLPNGWLGVSIDPMPNPWTGVGNPYTRDRSHRAPAGHACEGRAHHRGRRRDWDQCQVHREGWRGSHHHLQLRALPDDGARVDRRHDGLRGCQCGGDGDRRVRSVAGGRRDPRHLRGPLHGPAAAHVALAAAGEGDGVSPG